MAFVGSGMNRWLLITLVAALGGCDSGCAKKIRGRERIPVRLNALRASELAALDGDALSAAALENWVRRHLDASTVARWVDDEAAAQYELILTFAVAQRIANGESAAPPTIGWIVASDAELRGIGEGREEWDVHAGSTKPLNDTAHAATEIKQLIAETLKQTELQLRLLEGSDAALVAILKSDIPPAQLAMSVEIAALRRIPATVDPLITLLGSRDADVADRAIGALVAVGDRRAVKALTRLAQFGDTAKLAKVLDAIGQLGGPEAQAYLEFVAQGHSDPDIRDLAEESLVRMKRSE